jgi:hypothetical protein
MLTSGLPVIRRAASTASSSASTVGVEVPVALLLGRIAPADLEQLHLAVEDPSRQALLGRQVDAVELVDLRRADDQRPLVDLGRSRRVLDQLEHLVAKDHRARRRGDVLADLDSVLSTCDGSCRYGARRGRSSADP